MLISIHYQNPKHESCLLFYSGYSGISMFQSNTSISLKYQSVTGSIGPSCVWLNSLQGLASSSSYLRSILMLKQKPGASRHCIAAIIKPLGAEHFVLTTHLGQSGNVIPADGLRIFTENLKSQGISLTDFRTMMVHNTKAFIEFRITVALIGHWSKRVI